MADQHREPATYPLALDTSRLLWKEAYERAGLTCPVTQVLLRDGRAAWLVRGRTEVCRVLDESSFSRAAANEAPADSEADFDAQMRCSRSLLINMDPPEHTLVRRDFDAALTTATHRILPGLRARAQDTFRALVAAGPPCDLVPQVCVGYASAVLCDLLGVTGDDRARLHALAIERYYQSGSDPVRASASVQETYQIIERHLRGRHAAHGMIAELSAATSTLPIAASAANLLAALVAGHNNAASVIGNALSVILSDPEMIRSIYVDIAKREELINEVLSATPFQAMVFPRLAEHDLTLADTLVRRGDILLPHLDSGDSDHKLNSTTPLDASNGHLWRRTLIFGSGPHECPGKGLFIHMIEALLTALVEHLPPSLSLCSEIAWRDIDDIHSARHILIDWRPHLAECNGDIHDV